MDRNVSGGRYEQQYLAAAGEQADPALRQFFADMDALQARPLPPGLRTPPDWERLAPPPVLTYPWSRIGYALQRHWCTRWWGRPAGRWPQILYWLHLQGLLRGWGWGRIEEEMKE